MTIEDFCKQPHEYLLRVQKKEGKEQVTVEKRNLLTWINATFLDRKSYKLPNVIRALGKATTDDPVAVKAELIQAVASIARKEKGAVIAAILDLLTQIPNGKGRALLIKQAAKIESSHLKKVIEYASPLLTGITDGEEIAKVLDALNRSPASKMRDIATTSTLLCTGITNGNVIAQLITHVSEAVTTYVRHLNRSEAVQQYNQRMDEVIARLTLIITGNESVDERIAIIQNELQNRGDSYTFSIERSQLENDPKQVLNDLITHLSDHTASELKVQFSDAQGTDYGGLSRQLVSEVFHGIKNAMHFQERSNGLFRPTISSDDDKITLRQLGRLMMFCLNSSEECPIGMLFDHGVFIALSKLQYHHLMHDFAKLDCKEMVSIFVEMHRYDEKEKDIVKAMEISTAYLPLRDETIAEAFALVEDEKDMEDLIPYRENMDVLRKHASRIEDALKRKLMSFIEPTLAPIIELARGMWGASFPRIGWDDVHMMDPKTLATKLQGTVSREMIVSALQCSRDIPPEQKAWIEAWIIAADDRKIEQFLFALTGSYALGKQPLLVEKSQGEAIFFHTCFNRVEIPILPSKELLFLLLDTTIKGKEFTKA